MYIKSRTSFNCSYHTFTGSISGWVTFKHGFLILILIKFSFKRIIYFCFQSSKLLHKGIPALHFMVGHTSHYTIFSQESSFAMCCIHLGNSWTKQWEWLLVHTIVCKEHYKLICQKKNLSLEYMHHLKKSFTIHLKVHESWTTLAFGRWCHMIPWISNFQMLLYHLPLNFGSVFYFFYSENHIWKLLIVESKSWHCWIWTRCCTKANLTTIFTTKIRYSSMMGMEKCVK